jgi:hypothetical protein
VLACSVTTTRSSSSSIDADIDDGFCRCTLVGNGGRNRGDVFTNERLCSQAVVAIPTVGIAIPTWDEQMSTHSSSPCQYLGTLSLNGCEKSSSSMSWWAQLINDADNKN